MRAFAVAVALIGACLLAAPQAARAQATRTWVSGVGDDANPCSRTAPCKTFAGAISKTAAAGEINCIDPGGFGAVTITKSIAIKCDGVEAGVLVSGTNGIVVNAAATDTVFLSGLDLEGVGTGLAGVKVLQAAAVHIENSLIRGFGASPAVGVQVAPTTPTEIYISNTTIAENGTGSTGGGILVQPSGTGNANVVIDNARVTNNASGITGNGSGGTTAMNIAVKDSVISGNAGNGITATTPAGGAAVQFTLDSVVITANAGSGVNANGVNASGAGSANVRIGGSTISLNVTGVSVTNAGVVRSYKNNYIDGNGTNGTPITQVNMN